VTIKAIPTKYAGVQFRSRLEARWAAMFDMLGWEWEYEPIDLDGYIPDFIVGEKMLVEVKPDNSEFRAAEQKILQSGWCISAPLSGGKTAVVLGRNIRAQDYADWMLSPGILVGCEGINDLTFTDCACGFTFALHFGAKCEDIQDCRTTHVCVKCNKRVARCWWDSELRDEREIHNEALLMCWREAGNRVQWKSPTRVTPP